MKNCRHHSTIPAKEGRIIDAATAMHAAMPQIANSCVREMKCVGTKQLNIQ
jgi:hypothetical protein